jgi:hypothetical protein
MVTRQFGDRIYEETRLPGDIGFDDWTRRGSVYQVHLCEWLSNHYGTPRLEAFTTFVDKSRFIDVFFGVGIYTAAQSLARRAARAIRKLQNRVDQAKADSARTTR